MYTKNIQTFIDKCGGLNYQESLELSKVIKGKTDYLSVFTRKITNEKKDVIIGYKPTNAYLRMPSKQIGLYSKWLKDNLTVNYDKDSWYGLQYALDHDND